MSKEKQEKPQSLEETFEEIEDIINKMEAEEIPLEESFTLYQQGIKKLKECNRLLDLVEKKMQMINGEGELEEFTP